MRCPNPICQSRNTTTVNTYRDDDPIGIPREFQGLNIIRRRKRCEVCKEKFTTIEVTEEEFKHLRRKTGRLEVTTPSLRPGMSR